MDPVNEVRERLTDTDRAREMMPDFNVDGTKIAYTRCGQGEFSNCELWVMNADGSDPTRLTFTNQPEPFTPRIQETWPTWSPDGTKIAYTSNASDIAMDVWVMDSDGTDQTQLTVTTAFDAFPEWSPDGSKIVFTSNRTAADDIWVMDPDGSNPRRLTAGPKLDERPDWSPDGSQIVFSRNDDIWVMDANGSHEIELTNTDRDFAPTFSPRGNKIAFNRVGESGRVGVWLVRSDGSRPAQLTSGSFDFAPDWQPVANEP